MSFATSRRELGDAEAERFTKDEVLRRVGPVSDLTDAPWLPKGGPEQPPDAIIAPGPPGSAQAVIETVIAHARRTGQGGRRVIAFEPGDHEGLIFLPRVTIDGAPLSFTLSGSGRDRCRLTANIDAEMPGADFARRFGAQFRDVSPETRAIFERIAGRDKITTANASVMRIEADDTRVSGLTIRNSYNCDRLSANEPPYEVNAAGQASHGQHQAVALLGAGADRLHLRGLGLSSYQDTLYLQSRAHDTVVRACVEDCDIEGDVDFIFGQATAWFEGCTIRSIGARGAMSWVTAPSTNIRAPYGFVFSDCDFTHDDSPQARKGWFLLGRQWFEGVRATPYGASPLVGYRCQVGDRSSFTPPVGEISRATLEAVGKCVIRESRLGAHLHPAMPWGDWNGGDYTVEGQYVAKPWHPRFRPVQAGPRDFLRHLGPWLTGAGLDYAGLDPEEPWLAEYRNRRAD